MSSLTYSPGMNPALFTSNFPDIPPEEAQFTTAYNNFIATNPSGTSANLSNLNDTLLTRIQNLQKFQTSIISFVPEYVDLTTAPTLLSSFSTATTQNLNLTTQLELVNQNLVNAELSKSGNLQGIEFLFYTSGSIVLGIISIFLIAYLVYVYVGSSATVGGARFLNINSGMNQKSGP
jgi:hypothetical protein